MTNRKQIYECGRDGCPGSIGTSHLAAACPPPLTADTITDEQINELRDRGFIRARTALRALGADASCSEELRAEVRAFCAAIVNSRELLVPEVPMTAESITDEHIDALYRELMSSPDWGVSADLQRDAVTCQVALEYERMHWIRDERAVRARARCAEILNARQASKP